jgi:hypothetical protein
MDSSATKQGINDRCLWTRKWTFQNHKRREFLITRVERRNRIVEAIWCLSRKGLRHSARQEFSCIPAGWLTTHLTCVNGSNQTLNEVTFAARALQNHSAWERSSARLSENAENAIYITCGWDMRCRPDRPRGPPSLLYDGYRGYPRGKAAAAWFWSPTSFQMPGCHWIRATPPPPLCACMGMSWGDLYLYVETWFSLHLRNEFYNGLPSISSFFDNFQCFRIFK